MARKRKDKTRLLWTGNRQAQKEADAAFARLKPKAKRRRKKKELTTLKTKRHGGSTQRSRYQEAVASGLCPLCFDDIKFLDRTFKNGTTHIEMRCAACNHFFGWAPQTLEILDKVDMR